ncbi:MAG: M48 family metallopeptidase [Betaproteobacteria bacterium]|nr:MAG: M48 family metallopeptidase [Betaproteobacteria bacterium]
MPDSTTLFTSIFIVALVFCVGMQLWLALRQVRHVELHRCEVPPHFADRITLPAHRKAADYTIARTRLSMVDTIQDAVVLLALTLGGGIAAITAWSAGLPASSLWRDVALVVAVTLITGVIALPLSWYRTFVIEQRFGFNRMTFGLWALDLAKGALIAAILGIPLVTLVLWLMTQAGALWWFYTWIAWIAFQLLVLMLYPTLIAPLFNKFQPLSDATVKERVERLLDRCEFAAKGLFVMDGSRRSSHGNAYFTGFGAARRIVFFDTLLARLQPEEVEAVLAHELGHFKLKHVLKRTAWFAGASLLLLALLGWLVGEPWFYAGLGVPGDTPRFGVALVLFMLALPVFTFLASPLASLYSRRHEFEADGYAAKNSSAAALVAALVKLYEDNANTLTPDPLHSAFYDSHPPAAARISRLDAAHSRGTT